MAYVDTLYDRNFLEYASYYIKERAIPYIDDGLKPVQRRILHALYELDDGRFNKVANVVGHTMKFHPHGDMAIFDALVNLANKDLFIEKQGNFGNIFTGDEASAPRYIECRLTPLAREVLFNPDITEYVDSYDGRSKEPVVFPARIPVLLTQGTEGIAVGMSTRILPHNLIELLEAQIACLQDKPFQVFPDFPTGGQVDISEYTDGNGKVLVRARLDTSDPKHIVIRELPYGTTTESLIASIDSAAKKNKIKIASISDYTAENVEIEIRLARGVHTQDVVDSLYAFTDCESSISVNMMVIRDGHPHIMSVTEAIRHNTGRLLDVLKAELELEQNQLNDKLHARTLEQIFIENRIYKTIEEETSSKSVADAVRKGLEPFQDKIKRDITGEDIETLLRIPIRRISRYDINRAKKEMQDIRKRLKEIRAHLSGLKNYAIAFLKALIDKYRSACPRKTEIISFEKVDVRDAAQRNLKLRYDRKTGYLGYEVNGTLLADVSQYDRILIIRKNGDYTVQDVPDKLFVDKGMLFCDFIDEERVYNVLYKEDKTGYACIKRCKIDRFILNRNYELVSGNSRVFKLTTDSEQKIAVEYKPKPRMRILEEEFKISDYPVRGNRAKGIRLAPKEIKTAKFV